MIKKTIAVTVLALFGLLASSTKAQTCQIVQQFSNQSSGTFSATNTPATNGWEVSGSGFGPGGGVADTWWAATGGNIVGDFTVIAELNSLRGGTSPYTGIFLGVNGPNAPQANHIVRYYVDSNNQPWVEYDTWLPAQIPNLVLVNKRSVSGPVWMKLTRVGGRCGRPRLFSCRMAVTRRED